MKNIISEFTGKYFFLSNFFEAPVTYKGIMYRSNEAAFQAQKDISRSYQFQYLSPSEAKKLGRKVQLREDWEEVKNQIMYEIVKAKFSQNQHLEDLLLDTKDAELIEGNYWGDVTWGVCKGIGENRLGKILMKVREEIQNK